MAFPRCMRASQEVGSGPFSGDHRERVLNAKSSNLLPGVQIFGEEPCCTALRGGGDDERVPEAYPRFVFNTECHRKLGWSGFRAPDRVTANYEATRILSQRTPHLPGYRQLQFLQTPPPHNPP